MTLKNYEVYNSETGEVLVSGLSKYAAKKKAEFLNLLAEKTDGDFAQAASREEKTGGTT